MSKPLLSDALRDAIVPLLPPAPPKRKGGRPRLSDRAALTGIIFVLRTGTPWDLLPQELGCGSGMTCWRRLRDGQAAGVWQRIHHALLDRLGARDRIDWSQASLDSASIPAERGRAHQTQSDGSRQTGHEAPCCGRPHWYPPRRNAERGQCP